jgi:hypothetical protein
MRRLGALAAVLISVTVSAYATEYLQNGSFETGDVSGWAIGDASIDDGLGEVSYFLMASCWDPQICPADNIRSRHFKLQPRDRIRSQFSLRMTTVQTGLTISRSPALAPSPSSRPG